MHCRALTHSIALATVLSLTAAELLITPRNTESRVGDTTYFNCSTNLRSGEIFWNHGLRYIYTGETIIDPYQGRFEIDRTASNGSHNLVIHSVELGDAGEYICIDDDGHGMRRSAELVILDNDPNCQSNVQPDGVIGQNVFNIPPDEVQLTCTVTYYGNILPQMEWKKVGENISIKDNVTRNVTSSNRLIHNLDIKGDISLDKSSYVCQTTRSTNKQYKCTSKAIEVLYFLDGNTTEQNVVRGETITCTTSNNTFPCVSHWYHDNYTCPLSCAETITTHLLGEYLCMVKCHLRGKDYYFETLKAFVVEPITNPLLSTSGSVVAAVVVPIVVIILTVLIAAFIVSYYKKRRDPQMIIGSQRLLKYVSTSLASNGTNGHITNEEMKNNIRKIYAQFVSDVDPVILGDYLKQEKAISIDHWLDIIVQKLTAT